MKSTALLRLESLLQEKRFGQTVTRSWEPEPGVSAVPSGVTAVDRALGGGWRRGEVSELVGARSAGRTSVLLSTLARATSQGEVVGLVDAVDRFDPVSAAAAGVDLDRVLWVRGPSLTVESARPDSLNDAVHRGLRALDLIVRAGGFAVAALDVSDVPSRYLRALPWTTWLRVAHANEGRETVCLLVGDAPMGKSARGSTVRVEAKHQWTGISAQSRRLAGLEISVSQSTSHPPSPKASDFAKASSDKSARQAFTPRTSHIAPHHAQRTTHSALRTSHGTYRPDDLLSRR